MDGATLAAGAVAGITRVRNPVKAARAVMDSGVAVMMGGAAADAFAAGLGSRWSIPAISPRRGASTRSPASRRARRPARSPRQAKRRSTARWARWRAMLRPSCGGDLDRGFNNKPVGRIGDSPVIGAGTYAADGVCAVSCTGQGEIFLRCVAVTNWPRASAMAAKALQRRAAISSTMCWAASASARPDRAGSRRRSGRTLQHARHVSRLDHDRRRDDGGDPHELHSLGQVTS